MANDSGSVEREHYDFLVIGGGSGGSACARRAAGYGARVCLIERGATYSENGVRTGSGVGGTCVNVGCVPKKLMFNASSLMESISGSTALTNAYGLELPNGQVRFNWEALKEKRDAYIRRLNKGYLNNWKKATITVHIGYASFTGEKSVRVQKEDGSFLYISADKVLIACGGTPKMPNIPGAEYCISSDSFFDIEHQPRKAAVIGSGYIGVEMAGIFHGLGTDAHLFFRGQTVLRHGFDPFLVKTLMAEMEKHGPSLHPNSTPTSVTKAEDGTLTLTTSDGVAHSGFDCILMAIGRTPVTGGLNLASAGVDTDAGGFISVDEYENTTASDVYAIGDATTSGYELTPVAIAAGRRLADRLFKGSSEARIDYHTIATVVFSHPPIGTIGLTEPQAIERYGESNVKKKEAAFSSMLYAFSEDAGKVKTGLKLVLAGPEERVVGLHCIGPFSDEMLQGFAVAVRMGATRRDFEASVAIHPTIAEEFVTFGGWGQTADKEGVLLAPYLDKKRSIVTDRTFIAGVASGIAIAAAVVVGLAVRRGNL